MPTRFVFYKCVNLYIFKFQIAIIFESPTAEVDISKDLTDHGDFVKDVAFEVSNLDVIVEKAKKEGAEVIKDVTQESDKDGIIRYAVLKTVSSL